MDKTSSEIVQTDYLDKSRPTFENDEFDEAAKVQP
jgi:hypothetical protein